MPRRTSLIAAAFLLALVAPAAAGKRKGAATAPLSLDTPTTLKGLTITVAFANGKESVDGNSVAEFTLTIQKGKKHVDVDSGWTNAPYFEVIAFKKLIQIGAGDQLTVTVAPPTRLAKRAISEDRAIELVQAEADRRGIDYDGGGAQGGSGIVLVTLSKGADDVVTAVVGARSRDFLTFIVGASAAAPEPVDDRPAATDNATAFQQILDEHNRYRADHCAAALTWSDDLAAIAQKWADHLRDDNCAFEHSSTEYGENLAAGTTGSMSPADVVAMWYREVDGYDFKHGGFSMDTGHFTQLVWKGTQRVGCGVTQCNGLDVWVCNYDPAGNVDDEYARNVKPTSCK